MFLFIHVRSSIQIYRQLALNPSWLFKFHYLPPKPYMYDTCTRSTRTEQLSRQMQARCVRFFKVVLKDRIWRRTQVDNVLYRLYIIVDLIHENKRANPDLFISCVIYATAYQCPARYRLIILVLQH